MPQAETEQACSAAMDEMQPLADGRSGLVLWWHGWALRSMFLSGVAWERARAEKQDAQILRDVAERTHISELELRQQEEQA